MGIKNIMMSVISKGMLSCEQASILVSKKQHVKLTFKEYLSLRFHLMACALCRRYNLEIELIHQKLEHHSQCVNDGCSPYKLSENQRDTITHKLEKLTVD